MVVRNLVFVYISFLAGVESPYVHDIAEQMCDDHDDAVIFNAATPSGFSTNQDANTHVE